MVPFFGGFRIYRCLDRGIQDDLNGERDLCMIIKENSDNVRILTLNHESRSNPFSRDLQISLTEAVQEAKRDDSVRALVITGGKNRFFSAGGDFNEVQALKGGSDVDDWIDTFMALYLAVLTFPKPTIGALDGHSIGMGLQVALMLDWRIIADSGELGMPELKHGLGGSVGGAILTSLFGVESARRIMLGCARLTSTEALEQRMVNEVVPSEILMSRTLEVAQEFASYPEVAYKNTKAVIVDPLKEILERTADASKFVHREAFRTRAMHGHFKSVLGERKYNG